VKLADRTAVRRVPDRSFDPGWIIIELLGVLIYGSMGWKGVGGPLWWLAAAWGAAIPYS
jgi:hypothetical protein